MPEYYEEPFKKIIEKNKIFLEKEVIENTPKRAARAWFFLNEGYRLNISDIVNDAIFENNNNNIVIVKNIEFFSLCEHHLLPFFGQTHVGYIPNGQVIGLSKIPRIVDMFSRRLQIQERMTLQIADAIKSILNPQGVAVVVEGQHMCSMMRGVRKNNMRMLTSSMNGVFQEQDAYRREFMELIKGLT